MWSDGGCSATFPLERETRGCGKQSSVCRENREVREGVHARGASEAECAGLPGTELAGVFRVLWEKSSGEMTVTLRSRYLRTESSYLDLGRELAQMVYGHDIDHVLLLHLGAFGSTILPDALDLLEKKGFK